MKFFPSPRIDPTRSTRRGFTLVEVLAALLLMAIVVPVAMEGMSIASRAGIVEQRKAAAMRVAERVMNELMVTGQTAQNGTSGSITEGDTTYPWSMQTEPWPEDAMSQMDVRVTFTVQGRNYEVSLSTLFDPTVGTAMTAPATP